ncbi:partner and localizer of BRCA2 [Callorhinchus milii]|uniref:partner and localizer of BRCA2 n=1 Tax=Callorhinchus milii TaxID=7868 RepID=UPI0004575BC2|nr:partner and localizer of BRCA2 [Callorhinchus milii]|eukprot:gi/632975047/ref/XP_007904010.1/ PREDICTED: partner and localizer of BRCA2 [Callorhinchus milii]
MEDGGRKSFSCEEKEQLKQRLALLKKEYARTVHKLQRAQKAERVRSHVKRTIAKQNQLLVEQDSPQPTTEGEEETSVPDTRQAPPPGARVPGESSRERKTLVTFNLEPQVIDPISLDLSSSLRSCSGSAEESSSDPSSANQDPGARGPGKAPSRLKLKRRRGHVTGCAGAAALSAGVNQLQCPVVTCNSTHLCQPLATTGAADGDRHSSPLVPPGGEEDQAASGGVVHRCDGPGETVGGNIECAAERDDGTGSQARPLPLAGDSTGGTQGALDSEAPDRVKQGDCGRLTEGNEEIKSSDGGDAVGSESAVSQVGAGTRASVVPFVGPLSSCTLVEGLLFPVEYYVRTTRRMSQRQRQVDLEAVIHSQLGKSRSRHRGRCGGLGLGCEVMTGASGSPKVGEEFSDTQLLFNSQEEAASPEQGDTPQPTKVIQSAGGQVGRRARGRNTRAGLPETPASRDGEATERRPAGGCVTECSAGDSVACDILSEKENELGTSTKDLPRKRGGCKHPLVPSAGSSRLSRHKPVLEPLGNAGKKEAFPKVACGEQPGAVAPEPDVGLSSDTDFRDMIHETQQVALAGSVLGNRLLLPVPTHSQAGGEPGGQRRSQPRRRASLARGNGLHKAPSDCRRNADMEQTCSQPLLPVSRPLVKRLFCSLEVQHFQLPDEEYGRLKQEKLRGRAPGVGEAGPGCPPEPQAEPEQRDPEHLEKTCSQEEPVGRQTSEDVEQPRTAESWECQHFLGTPEEPTCNIPPSVQQTQGERAAYELSPCELLATPPYILPSQSTSQPVCSVTSTVFPSLGLTPAPGSPQYSGGFSQSEATAPQSTGVGSQRPEAGGQGCPAACLVSNTGIQCIVSVQDHPHQPGEEQEYAGEEAGEETVAAGFEDVTSSHKAAVGLPVVGLPEDDSVIEEESDCGPSCAAGRQRGAEEPLRFMADIPNPSSCVTDVCSLLWGVSGSSAVCVAIALELTVSLWAPQSRGHWDNIHTWVFKEVPVIQLVPLPGAENVLCVAFGDLEIREVSVLCCADGSYLEPSVVQAGEITAVLGLRKHRLVCSCCPLQQQRVELLTINTAGRREVGVLLQSLREEILAFSEVEGEEEVLLGSTNTSDVVLWNVKTRQLLKRIHLSDSFPGTVCHKAYSQCGLLFVLLIHRYARACQLPGQDQLSVSTLVAINPLSGKSRPVMSYCLPPECRGRYLNGDVKDRLIAAVVTPGSLAIWDMASGRLTAMLSHCPDVSWSLFQWAETGACLLAGKNDGTVYIYRYAGVPDTGTSLQP